MIQSRCNRWLTYTVIAATLPLIPALAQASNPLAALALGAASTWIAARLAGLLPGAYTAYLTYTMLGDKLASSPGLGSALIATGDVILPVLLLAALHGGRRKPHAVLDALQYTRPRFSPLLVYLTAWQALYTLGLKPTGLPETIPPGALPALAAGLIAWNRLEAVLAGLLPLHPAGAAAVMAAAALRPLPAPSCNGPRVAGRLVAVEGKAGSARSVAGRRGRGLVCVQPSTPVIEPGDGRVVLWYYTSRSPEIVIPGLLVVFDLSRAGYSEDALAEALAHAGEGGEGIVVGLGGMPLEQRLALLQSILSDSRLQGFNGWVVVDARGIEVDKPSQLVPSEPAAGRIAVVLDYLPGESRLHYAPRGYRYAVAVYDADRPVVEAVARRFAPWARLEELEGHGVLWPYCGGLTAVYRLSSS